MNEVFPAAIVGEAEAGESAKLFKQVKQLVKGLNTSTFDLGECLYKIRVGKMYAPKYSTFSEYIDTLDLKASKAHYLVRIVEVMETVGVKREQYEPVGIAKLRVISRLDPETKKEDILALLGTATNTGFEELKDSVSTAQGQTGEDAMGWLNIPIKVSAKKVVQDALERAKAHIGSVGTDGDGMAVDASDGRALEMIAANFLQDPNFEEQK